MDDATEPRPARPLRPKVRVDQAGDTLTLRYRHREWGGGCFLILWLTGWTVGCIFLAGLVMREPTLGHLLFAVPFWASWLFVFALLCKMFFQREEFSLGPTGAAFCRRVLVEIKRRETPLEEIKAFGTFERVVDSESGRTESGIEMTTLGLPLEFAAGLDQPELLWLQDTLRQQLSDLRERYRIGPPVDADAAAPPAESDGRSDSDPPSDCSWRCESDFEGPIFRQSGRLSVVAIGVLLFVNAFWNGGVSVFVCVLFGVMEGGPEGAGWWGMFVFLIPFVVIGLVMFAGLLLTLLEPLRRTSIQVGQSSITYRLTWFGVGPSWDYPIESLDRIEVKNKEAKQKRSANNATIPWKTTGATFRLSFVDRSNREVCSIDGLTEGEARWMAAAIEKERPVWFR